MDFICCKFEYNSLFNIVNCQMCEKLIHGHTCVVILLIEYDDIMWIMYNIIIVLTWLLLVISNLRWPMQVGDMTFAACYYFEAL